MPIVDRQLIVNQLCSHDLPAEYKLWAILDGARDDRIYSAVTYLVREKYCLYRGKLAPELVVTAPYLVQLEPNDALFNHVLQLGWGNSWGIFLRAKQTGEELRRHFRRFLIVQDEEGKRFIFRYYDPRVLRIFLPTCSRAELRTVFGPVSRFLVEAEEQPTTIITYSVDSNLLNIGTTTLQNQQTASGLAGLLVVRKAQFDALSCYMEKSFEDRMLNHLSESFPERGAQLGRDGLLELIRTGVQRARTNGFSSEREIATFIDVLLVLGLDFETRADTRWAGSILSDGWIDSESKLEEL